MNRGAEYVAGDGVRLGKWLAVARGVTVGIGSTTRRARHVSVVGPFRAATFDSDTTVERRAPHRVPVPDLAARPTRSQ